MTQQNKDVFEKLRSWLQRLENQVIELHEHRLVFERVRAIVGSNPNLNGNVFFEGLNLWYTASMSIGVRRLADKHRDSVSYFQLLKKIENNPEAISRKRVIAAWNGHELASAAFDQYAGVGAEYLPSSFVTADIEKLQNETKIITDFADKYVAHNDLVAAIKIPEFEDLSTALKCLESIHNKYVSLLTGYSTSMEVSILYAWDAIFREPWIK